VVQSTVCPLIEVPAAASVVLFTVNVFVGVETVKVCVTDEAAAYVPFPAWLAVIEHVPLVRMVTVAPLVPVAVQIAVEFEANCTGSKELE
jgi:hypothetical protein